MREWTEQEEQQMIALAKQGDPQANYELSQWALRRGEEEPEESRWNRLAAKCLVKAAQAGYAPAQARMAELLHASNDGAASAARPEEEEPAPARRTQRPAAWQEPEEEEPTPIRRAQRPAGREPVRLSDARQAASRRAQAQSPVAPQSTARRPASRPAPEAEEGYDQPDGNDEYDEPSAGRRRGGLRERMAAGGMFSGWNERQWRRLEIICVAVSAALLLLIAVMIVTSRGGGSGNGNSSIPPAGEASAAATPTPAPADYPPEAVIEAIQAAELEIPPGDDEYVTVPTTATVRVGSTALRLRTGPNTEYDVLTSMPNDTLVDIYAKKNDWCLVAFNDAEKGTIYGWCSSEYLFITTGAANTGVS